MSGIFSDLEFSGRQILKRLRDSGLKPAYIGEILDASPAGAVVKSNNHHAFAESLTQRELEILNL